MKSISKVFFSVLLGVFVILQSGCMQSFNFKMDYDKGVRAYNEKNYEEAIVSLTSALNYNPNSYSTYCLLGTSYAYKGDNKNAERVLLEAVQAFPDKWNAYVFLADLYRTKHEYSKSAEYYEKAASIESMPEGDRGYYKKLIADVRKEEYKWNSDIAEPQDVRMAKLLSEKKNNTPTADTAKKDASAPISAADYKAAAQDSKEPVSLDWTKWQNSYTVNNGKNSTTEYGLKGEDIKNFQWTQLVTIQHFAKDEQKPVNADEYFTQHLKPIEDMAKNTQKSFSKEVISRGPKEIIYQWTFDGGKESEVARIVETEKGIDHFHYAKKGTISTDERAKWVNTLKNAKNQ